MHTQQLRQQVNKLLGWYCSALLHRHRKQNFMHQEDILQCFLSFNWPFDIMCHCSLEDLLVGWQHWNLAEVSAAAMSWWFESSCFQICPDALSCYVCLCGLPICLEESFIVENKDLLDIVTTIIDCIHFVPSPLELSWICRYIVWY